VCCIKNRGFAVAQISYFGYAIDQLDRQTRGFLII
jgi:hypothetical protein